MQALEGHRMSDHHRQMIRYSLKHLEFVEEQIGELDLAIASKIKTAGLQQQWELLQTLPGPQRGHDSGRNRWRYGAVSFGERSELMGRSLSGQQS
jgi:hypothetical protein